MVMVFDVVRESRVIDDYPKPFHEGKGKDPLIRKRQFCGKGKKKKKKKKKSLQI